MARPCSSRFAPFGRRCGRRTRFDRVVSSIRRPRAGRRWSAAVDVTSAVGGTLPLAMAAASSTAPMSITDRRMDLLSSEGYDVERGPPSGNPVHGAWPWPADHSGRLSAGAKGRTGLDVLVRGDREPRRASRRTAREPDNRRLALRHLVDRRFRVPRITPFALFAAPKPRHPVRRRRILIGVSVLRRPSHACPRH